MPWSFFQHIPLIKTKLQTLHDVGLHYIKLGQSATTLSGGEAQRVKLSRELSKRATGRTMYILDEPTTGLHFADIQQLLTVLNRLVEAGNTVLVIEHNVDVIKNADWVIDLGPEGGEAGGGSLLPKERREMWLVFSDLLPEKYYVIFCRNSHKGRYEQMIASGEARMMRAPPVWARSTHLRPPLRGNHNGERT